jgi:hypothetical protein
MKAWKKPMGSACSAWLWLSPECAACALLRSEVSVMMLLSEQGELISQGIGRQQASAGVGQK